MLDDAADTAIRDMERAGVDVITDGEVRRLDGYVDSLLRGHQGHPADRGAPEARAAGATTSRPATRPSAKIETPDGGLGIVKEFEYLKAHTTRGVKATCAGPLTFGSRIHPGGVYKGVVQVAERFAEVINQELKGLVAAGAELIQIDEPARGHVSGQEMARLFNLATEGVRARARLPHLLRQPLRPLSVRPDLSALLPGAPRGPGGPVRAGVRRARDGRARLHRPVRPRGPRARAPA